MTAMEIESKGNAAIMALRQAKLKNGHPFMINSKDMPSNICYLEYPDGSISLVTFKPDDRQFIIIRTLTAIENIQIREKFKISMPATMTIDKEDYSKEIDAAVARVEAGEYYTQYDVENMAKDW